MFRITIAAVLLLLIGVGSSSAQRWEKMPLAAPYDAGFYLDIYFLPSNPQLGWVCDQKNGYIVKTTNGGATWTGIASVKANCHLEYIQFLDANTGYCSGPCGAFKSTDGGFTWTEILTFPNQAYPKWGGWFRDANNGWFTGGGCGRATFMHTTDGGVSFNMYIDSAVTRSNLTDALWDASMPANTVYAVGNGTLWKSVDDGQTFQVESFTGTTSPWHEEIAHSTPSFLVSCATTNCSSGGYTGGGMRFSVDGTNWRHTETGEQMFGVCLMNSTTGWASGWNGSVYYTADAGLNWEKRNCGLDGANMDDIIFLDANTGWVVGAGIFRLASPKRTQSDSAFSWTLVCPDSTVRDTVTVRNLNFFSSPWTASISGTDADLFRISNTIGTSIASCGPVPIIVEYTAGRPGVHTALLRIDIKNPDTTLFVTLRGDRREKSAVPRDTLVSFNVRVGTTDSRQLIWRALLPWNEQITAIVRISGDTNISLTTPLPLTVIPEGVQTVATATPIDTGWIEAKFLVRLRPCVRDTIITVRVYGTSPILESITVRSADMGCKQRDTLRIPMRNTGNAPLDITDVYFTGPGAAAFKALYWSSGRRPFPETFAVGVSDTLVVEGKSVSGDDIADLVLVNNDLSTKRGKKNPWMVSLRLISLRPIVTAGPPTFNLGSMCVGASVTRSVELNNLSSRIGTLMWTHVPANVTGLTPGNWYITPGQRRSVNFTYTPKALGPFSDTLTLLLTPCDTMFTFVVKGVVNDFSLVITPPSINDSTPSGTTITARAVVRMVGPGTATVSTIWFKPPSPLVTITTTPTLPISITANDSIVVQIRFNAQGETTVLGTLEATATAPCTTSTAIPVRLRSMLMDLAISKSSMSFSEACVSKTMRDTVSLTWKGATALSMHAPVFDIAGPFTVEQPTGPFTLVPNTPFDIVVAYTPQSFGVSNATLMIVDDGQTIAIAIPVAGDLRVSNPTVVKGTVDFGDVDACQPTADSTITLYNLNANDRAMLSPFGATVQGGIALIGSWPLTIEPNDSATVVIRSTPALTAALAPPASFTLIDAVCGKQIDLQGRSNLTSGKLLMEPSSVDVGSMDTGQTASRTVIIFNPTNQARTIVSLGFAPSIPQWTIVTPYANRVVPPNDTVRVDLMYAPHVSGVHTTDLVLLDKGLCDASTSVTVRGEATVPLVPPRHKVNLFIDDYVAGPSEPVTIPVHWQNDVSAARIDSVFIEIGYLNLPYKIDTVHAGTLGRETQVYWDDSVVQFKLYGDPSSPLGMPGVIGIMHGIARSSIPDSTAFKFKSIVVWSIERVDSAPRDGSLIVDACGPRFFISITTPTRFSAAPSPNGLAVHYTALQQDAGSISVYDATGALITTRTFDIGVGEGEIDLGATLSSGVYVVHVESASRGRLNALHPVVR